MSEIAEDRRAKALDELGELDGELLWGGALLDQNISTPNPEGGRTMSTDGWRDIATAPKDGTPFLACERGFVRYFLWREEDELGEKDGYPWRFADTSTDHFIEENGYPTDFAPTHWRPLPAPPHTDKGE